MRFADWYREIFYLLAQIAAEKISFLKKDYRLTDWWTGGLQNEAIE